MTPDNGPGIPGWFIALAIIVVLIGVGGGVWRVMMARKMAHDADLDPSAASKMTLLSNNGLEATYLASSLKSQSSGPTHGTRNAEQRLRELLALKDKQLITEAEYDSRRNRILDSM